MSEKTDKKKGTISISLNVRNSLGIITGRKTFESGRGEEISDFWTSYRVNPKKVQTKK